MIRWIEFALGFGAFLLAFLAAITVVQELAVLSSHRGKHAQKRKLRGRKLS